jgi:hypothetical protein
MKKAPEPNRIPAAPIVQVVQRYLQAEGTRLTDGTFVPAPLSPLAERIDVHADTLESWLTGHVATIDFDVADRLLCAMNQQDLWHTDLQDLYLTAPLQEGKKKFSVAAVSGSKVCARIGCSVRFTPKIRNPRQRFCCRKCYQAYYQAEKQRGGYKQGAYGPGCSLLALTCRNGHQRTTKNTKFNKHGRRYCVDCKRLTDVKNRIRRAAEQAT